MAKISPVIADDVRRVDAQLLGGDFGVPAVGEGFPRTRHLLDLKLPEVGLKELLLVVAELHVKVAIETDFLGILRRLKDGQTLEVRFFG